MVVDPAVWKKVHTLLKQNAITTGRKRSQYGGCLGGLIRCVACGSAMSHLVAGQNGTKRYRYYVCVNAQKRGWHNCPAPSIPAAEIEKYVVAQIRGIGRDPELIGDTLDHCNLQSQRLLESLGAELAGLDREIARWGTEIRDVVAQVGPRDETSAGVAWLAELQERLRTGEHRAHEIREEMRRLSRQAIQHEDVARALGEFDALWEALTYPEQSTVMRLLVERVTYDGPRGKLAVTIHPQGMMAFMDQFGGVGEIA